MPSDSIEKIQAKRQAQAEAEAERAKNEALIGAVTETGSQTTDTLSKSMHDILMATMIGKDPRIAEVAGNLTELLQSIATASNEVKDSGLKEVKTTFKKLLDEVSDLPNRVAATDKSAELIPFIQQVEVAVRGIRVNPSVTVNEREQNLKPVTDLLKSVEKAIKDNKVRVDVPKQDNEELLSAIKGTTKAINSLSFPVSNYVLPFKDSSGKAVQVQVDGSGNVPTSSTASADGTASGTISTQNLVPAGVATALSAVEITLGASQNTIAIQTVGVYTGALTLQGTVNGTDWVSFAGTPLLNANTGLWLATITSALQSVFFAKVSGFAKVRISANAAMTGSVVVSIGASRGDSFQGAMGVLTTVTTVTTLTNITNWGNIVDNAAFTDGTTRISMNGYIYDDVAGTALTENDGAAARINVNRAQVATIEDGTTRGRYATVTAAGAQTVDGSGVTQPISGSVTANAGTSLNTSALALDATLTGGTQRTKITDGTSNAAVKAASTAAIATDPAVVVAISPNNTAAVTQSTSPWVTSNATTSVVGNGAAATAQRVTLANDSTGIVSLTTSTASIGKLAANSGVDIGDVDVTTVGTITPGTAATSLGKAEDAVHSSGDVGVFSLGIANEAQSTLAADGDYIGHASDIKGNALTVGNLAHDAVDAGNPLKIGGQARTTNPTAVSDADRTNFIADKLGKQIVVGSIRDLKGNQFTTITSSTGETTVVTAVASTFLDVYGVIVENTSATACKVTFKDSTAGTTQFEIYVPAGDTRGFTLSESAAFKQTTVNNNWTATCGTSVASIVISALFVKNT